jgi:hypothetical protein
MGVEIETSSCVVAHELNEEWASMIKKYVRQIEEMQVELCATIKELEEFVATILQQYSSIKYLTQQLAIATKNVVH